MVGLDLSLGFFKISFFVKIVKFRAIKFIPQKLIT